MIPRFLAGWRLALQLLQVFIVSWTAAKGNADDKKKAGPCERAGLDAGRQPPE